MKIKGKYVKSVEVEIDAHDALMKILDSLGEDMVIAGDTVNIGYYSYGDTFVKTKSITSGDFVKSILLLKELVMLFNRNNGFKNIWGED